MKNIINTLVFLALCSACRTQSNNSESKFTNELLAEPNKKSIEINELFKSFDVVSLNGDELIPNISSIFIIDSLMIVGDVYSTESIYFFDLDGNYKNKWDGSQDNFFYLNEGIKDFKIDPKRDEITILSESGTKLHRFDFEGNFINTHSLEFRPYSFTIDYDGNYYFDLANEIQEGISYNLTKLDPEESKTTNLKPTPNENLNITLTTDKTLSSNRKKTYYIPCLEQAVYEIVKDSLQMKYKLDYSSSSLPKDYLNSIHDSPPLMQDLDSRKFAIFPRLFATSSEIVVNSQIGSLFKGFKHFLIVNLKNNSTINFTSLTMNSNNLDFNLVGNTVENFIFTINPEQVINQETSKGQYQILSGLLRDGDNQNPIILIGKVAWD